MKKLIAIIFISAILTVLGWFVIYYVHLKGEENHVENISALCQYFGIVKAVNNTYDPSGGYSTDKHLIDIIDVDVIGQECREKLNTNQNRIIDTLGGYYELSTIDDHFVKVIRFSNNANVNNIPNEISMKDGKVMKF